MSSIFLIWKKFNIAHEFKRGRTRLENDPRERRPKSAITTEIIEQVHNKVSEDPSLTNEYFIFYITYEKAVWKLMPR